MNYEKIKETIDQLHLAGKTADAAQWILQMYDLQDDNLKGFEFREKAEPSYILLTTEGDFGEPQIMRIPENLFEFPLPLMISLIAHEMVHVRQKTRQPYVLIKEEREWQAYYQMLFGNVFPNLPEIATFNKIAFAQNALNYYKRMGEGSALQAQYANQKKQVDDLLTSLT